MFDTTKDDLKSILKQADAGKLQLPDFQRDYVWDDNDVVSLIGSIAKGFPVGALLTLESGGPVNFKPRVIEGVKSSQTSPEALLLDGQQRITSLYQTMFAKEPARSRSPKGVYVERYYYIDIKKALEEGADIEDAIVRLPADRIARKNFGKDVDLDVSTQELEFEHDLFPLNRVFDNRDWFYSWRDYWRKKNRDNYDLERDFYKKIIEVIDDYKMPIIKLDKSNSREAICLVFEKVNVGGRKLDAFELVTAIFASDSYDLREDWSGKGDKKGRFRRILGPNNQRLVLKDLACTDFLQSCTLLSTRQIRLEKEAEGKKDKELPQISCKRESILELPLNQYLRYTDNVEKGFIEAAAFLHEQKIYWNKDIPYFPLVIGLASVFAICGENANTVSAKQKLSQWFWCITMGELYGSSTESRLARDVPDLVDWIMGHKNETRSISEALFQIDRLRTLKTRQSSAYKGIHALLMQHGAKDFVSGKETQLMTFYNDKIDIHHIFPQKWCRDNGIPAHVYNSVINKSPLSKRTNGYIGGKAPSYYLKRIQEEKGISEETMDQLLRTHLINPEHLRTDNFDAFYEHRMKALGEMVGTAMGKPIVYGQGSDEPELEMPGIGALEDWDEDEDIQDSDWQAEPLATN